MTAPTPTQDRLQDRGAALVEQLAICRVSRRSLAISGHVDDLIATSDGRILRLPEALAIAASATGATVVVVNARTGLKVLTPPGSPRAKPPMSAGPAPAGELLERALREIAAHGQPTMLVLTGTDRELEDDDDLAQALRTLAVSSTIPQNIQLVAVFRSALPPASLAEATGWGVHHIELPSRNERLMALNYWQSLGALDATTLDVEDLASVTGGLELDDLRRLVQEHTQHAPLAPNRVSVLRSAALTRRLGNLLRVDLHPTACFDDIAGGDAVRAVVAGATRTGCFRPLGLWGPPGVGKTLIANAIARELSVPVIYVDGTLKGSFVGQTARNLALFREVVTAYAPAVVFLDEIDLLLGSTSDYNGDSGTSNEIRQAMLVLFQDATSLGVQIVAASNNPWSRIQLRIRNRLRSIPMIHPTGEDVLAIARLEATKLGTSLDETATALFTRATNLLWNGRDIERVLAAALDMARLTSAPGDGIVLGTEQLELLVQNLAAGHDTAAELNALEAILVTDNPYDLPWVARRLAGRPEAPLPRYLDGMLDAEGLPIRKAIRMRLEAEGLRDAQ